MKGKNLHISTRFFNFRLFLEGLKRLRIIGLATAILSLTASALVPIVYWMNDSDRYYTVEMQTEILCIPVGLVVLMAPLFFHVLFSFLQKRKESDFFHAIPYTRTCVYVSFVSAALSFVFAIQLACGLLSGILWGMIPYLIFDVGGLISYVLICMLAAAMLSSFMMLSRTVTGTSGSCVLLFLLFASFIRILALIFHGCMDTIALLPMDYDGFFAVTWFLPLNVLTFFASAEEAGAIMYSLPNLLYSILATLAIYALAGLLYQRRQSEMAGNPAPGTRTQTLFRVMFTMIPALTLVLLLIQDHSLDTSLLLIMVVLILLTYFLYELITTKRPKNMLKAIPGLGFVVAGCILFAVAFYGYRFVILHETVETKDVRSVSVEGVAQTYGSYQSILLNHHQTDDAEIVQLVVDQLAQSQEEEGLHLGAHTRKAVTIRLKGGRTIRRYIKFSEEQVNQLRLCYRRLDEKNEAIYRLPSDREITNATVRIRLGDRYIDSARLSYGSSIRLSEVMDVYREEYEALSYAEREGLMNNRVKDPLLRFQLHGNVYGESFYDEYMMTDAFPRTRAYLLTAWCLDGWNYYIGGGEEQNGRASIVLNAFLKDLEAPDFYGDNAYAELALTITPAQSTDGVALYDQNMMRVQIGKLPELLTLLLERDVIGTQKKVDPEKISLTQDTYCLRLTVDTDPQNQYMVFHAEASGLFNLTDEDLQKMEDILGIHIPNS